MKCIHQTSDRTRAQLLRGALEAQGVHTIVQGEHLTGIHGEVPTGASAEYRVCIVDDEQLPRAALLARQWLAEFDSRASESWECARCGERHEAQFGSCWRCGAESGRA